MASGHVLLTGVSPTIAGLRWQNEQRLRIGRQGSLEVVINDPSLGRQHTDIRLTPQGWVVEDLGEPGGTLVNGVALGRQTRKLQQEDALQCGRLRFKVTALLWEAAPSPARLNQDIRTSGPVVRVQAHSQLTWEQVLREPGLDSGRVSHGKQFLTLLRAGYHLSHIASLTELLQSLLDDTVAVLDAQRGAILLLDDATGKLALKTVAGARSNGPGRGYSQTLVQRCFSQGESLLCRDPRADAPRSESRECSDTASIICVLLRSPRRRLGVVHLDRGPIQQAFSEDDFKLADAVATTVAVGIESAAGIEKQRTQSLHEVAELLQQAMTMRNARGARHAERVAALAMVIAEPLALSRGERELLQLGARLHEIGQLAGDGGQSPALRAVAIAEKFSGFATVLPILRSHLESWDGSGQPDGLKGEQIPRLARIVAVADALDRLLVDGADQPPLAIDAALAQIVADAGHRYDPDIVKHLTALQPRFDAILAQGPTLD
jgi:HD-GYP domain-containing protein (c-di-GMP phosphodiesterase class II)